MANTNIRPRAAVADKPPAVTIGGAASRLGLHVTDQELAIWQDRAVNGPYKTAGDVSTNSPGDWDRIAANALTFKNASKPYQQWAGQVAASAYNLGGAGAGPGRGQGERLLAAAFYYLVTADTSYGDLVVTDLVAQAGVTGTNFADTVRWSHASYDDSDNAFSVAMWLCKLLHAYDYVKDDMSGAQRTTMDTWFLNAATYWEANVDLLIEAAFPNRDTDDYSSNSGAGDNTGSKVCYYGGPTNDFWGEHWNNRSSIMVQFFTSVGVMQNNSTLISRGKRWFEEWVKYNVFADGTAGEFYRWEVTVPCLGWDYASMVIGTMAAAADVLARSGDYDLYIYSTSTGRNNGNHDTSGGPKTLLQIATLHAQHLDHTVTRYGTATAGNNGNANYIIDSVDPIEGTAKICESCILPFTNIFFQDSYLKSIYMRTASGAPAYPATAAGSGWEVYGGAWGVFPGVMFMFGDNETVDPYP